MYILLHGVRKNAGDFLIKHRTISLLKKYRPDREIIEFPSWEDLTPHLNLINSSKAIIIHGGPGYQRHMYPNVYPLVENLDNIRVPIIPMALGWKGIITDEKAIRDYKFSKESRKLLKKIIASGCTTSCRDTSTLEILRYNDCNNVIMTGCSVWYVPEGSKAGNHFPREIKKIALSTPALPSTFPHALELGRQTRELFPKAEIHALYNHGFQSRFQSMIEGFSSMGIQNIEAFGSLLSFDTYLEYDLHIGYRLHAHLFNLSLVRPSYLINEDGRGGSMQISLGLRSFDGYRRTLTGKLFPDFWLSQLGNQWGNPRMGIKPDFAIIPDFLNYVLRESEEGYPDIKKAEKTVHRCLPDMVRFLKSLP